MSEHEWELNRENIRPLRSGRKVKSINTVFGGARISITEAEERFEKDLKLAEASDNPLDICMHYISWFEEHFPTGKQSHLFTMLTRIINTFGYREEFLNDERMLTIWIKLTENKSDANVDSFFERAYLAGCCRRLAKFYVRWAEVREDSNDINGARIVLKRGRENCAEPINLLNEASDALEMRQLRAMLNCAENDSISGDGIDFTDDADANMQRLALSQLTGLGPKCEAPVLRTASHRTGSLHAGSQPPAKSSASNKKEGNKFQIYQGNELLKDEQLIPKSFGDGLAHIAFVQNSWDPTKWKDARIDGIRKTDEKHSASFTVFDEESDTGKERKQKSRQRLLSVNKITSIEEILAEHTEF